MSDPLALALVALLVAALDLVPRPPVPLGLVLAIGLLLTGLPLGPTALLGAGAVLAARLATTASARLGRVAPSSAARQRQDALHARMAASAAFARITFVMAALPGPTATLLYPMLGAMRAPLLPAVAGTIVGRTTLYLLTTSIFAALGRWGSGGDDEQAANALVTIAILLLLVRMVGWIDWQHRAATGTWRLRDPAANGPMASFGGSFDSAWFGTGVPPHGPGAGSSFSRAHAHEGEGDDPDVIDGEVVGEDYEDDDEPSGDGSSRGSLPSGS